MLGRGREEVKRPGLSLIFYIKAFVVMFVYIFRELIDVMIRLAVGCIFFSLMVFTLLPYLGFGFSTSELRIVVLTGVAFVFCKVAFTLGNSLMEFIYMADIDNSDIEEV